MENNNNNNMTPEEKFSKLLEEMKKLGNIKLSEEFTDAAKGPEKPESEDFFEMMSKLGKNKVKEAEQFVKKMKESVTGVKEKEECQKQAEQPQSEQVQPEQKEPEIKKSPDKNDLLEALYNEYRSSENSKVKSLVNELTVKTTDDEQLGICCCIEKAAEAETKAAFIAGFEAAKELLK